MFPDAGQRSAESEGHSKGPSAGRQAYNKRMVPRALHLAALVGLVVVALTASPTPSPSAPLKAAASPVPRWASRGYIVHKCGDSLCLMRPDGSGSRKLLAAAHRWPQWDPAVSPNGSLLAFRGYYAPFAEGNFALYIVNTDGCALRRVTRSGAVNPSWSPDGRWIAFDTSGGGEIWKVRPDGSGLVRIAGNGRAEQDSSPAWSPDGSRIAFIRVRRRHGQVWVMRPDGSRATQLHKDARASDGAPVWSRDGTRIAFVVQAWPRSWIEVMQADGTKLRVLTVKRGAASNPVWLPSDAGIAFLAGAMGPELSVMRRDGTDVHRLAFQRTAQFTWVDAPLPQQRC